MEDSNEKEIEKPVFKKPILIGKIGRPPKKLTTNALEIQKDKQKEFEEEIKNILKQDTTDTNNENNQNEEGSSKILATPPLNYKEPKWSGLVAQQKNNTIYCFEVLKSGVIVEKIDLMTKCFYIVGRLPNCDIVMAHPTISRYHAIIQYKGDNSENQAVGFYVYDLGSTHGTFVNKQKCKPNMFVPIQVGHMLKFGNSTRNFILNGPNEELEPESELTVTELKEKREEQQKQIELERLAKLEKEKDEQLKLEQLKIKELEQGIDWGMGEDAQEDDLDLSDNPFAMTENEELFLDDPKKTLRGFFEREGYELEYDVEERGIGQFLCRIELPLDDSCGRPLVAEVLIKGKKKEAVAQCALEACRILDRAGVLRQAKHESRKRKTKNWEENDFYDSDEDEFLDRSGAIERKRQIRMKLAGKSTNLSNQVVKTYDNLVEEEKIILEEMRKISLELFVDSGSSDLGKKNSSDTISSGHDDDELDAFMSDLNKHTQQPNKQNLNIKLSKLNEELKMVRKLLNVAKPTSLPKEIIKSSKSLPIIGKRIKLKPIVKSNCSVVKQIDVEEKGEEFDEDDESQCKIVDDDKLDTVKVEEENNIKEKKIDVEENKNEERSIKVNRLEKDKSRTNEKQFSRIETSSGRSKLNKNKIPDNRSKINELVDDDKYTTWLPPEDQKGDGKTKLNEKYGY